MKITDLRPTKESETAVTGHSSVASIQQQSAKTDLPFYRKLGRTDLTVSCLGLGGGGHISSEDTLYAFEQGVNYFFYSSDLHHYTYSSMAPALRKLCGRQTASSLREKVVLACVTYVLKSPDSILAALLDQLSELGLDYIDVFFWGWVGSNDGKAIQDCLSVSNDLRGANSVYQRQIEKWFGTCERMKKMGIVRYIGASFHDLDIANQCLNSPLLDVVMVRHNIAHRNAQKKIFANLDANDSNRSGIVTFKSAGMGTNLWEPPLAYPKGFWKPTPADLYRYSLSQNSVDVALAGWRNRKEIDEAIANVKKGKFTPEEIQHLNLYGDLHRGRIKIDEITRELLLT